MDLSTIEDIRVYLASTPFASEDIVELSEGTANYTFRIRLVTPYERHPTLVFKHAKPYVKNRRTFPFELERQKYEVEALKQVKAWLPDESIVKVPKVHLFDQEANVIIMDDAGEEAVNLKKFIQTASPSVDTCTKIGTALGEFIGGMHVWSRGNAELLKYFGGNVYGKKTSAQLYYGNLVATLGGGNAGLRPVPKLSDPPLEVSEEELEVARQVAEETTQAMMDASDTFVMGDFWPGNIMVNVNEKKELESMYVIDWELAKLGLAGVEIGQFCAEMDLLRRFNELYQATASGVLDGFMSGYQRGGELDALVLRRARVHWGVHMVVLGPRVDWGGKSRTREVVRDAVVQLVNG